MYTSLIKVVVSANSFIFKQNTNYCVSSMQTKDKKKKKKKNLKTSCTEKFLNGAVQIFEDAIKIMDLKNNYKYRLCGF